jgi:hypothetical protein
MTIHRIALIFSAAALTLVPAASASHLAMPESALFHKGKIYVSLIGDPENNDGAIVIVDSSGRVTGFGLKSHGSNLQSSRRAPHPRGA